MGNNYQRICIPSLIPRKLKTKTALAGLLTYPRFLRPSHSACGATVAFRLLKTLHRTYSSGSVQDLHLIPF